MADKATLHGKPFGKGRFAGARTAKDEYGRGRRESSHHANAVTVLMQPQRLRTGSGAITTSVLLANKNRVVSRKSIAEHLFGAEADNLPSFDFVYSQMKNLKKKLPVL